MCICVHEGLGMGQGHRDPEVFSQAFDVAPMHKFPCGDEICSDGCLRKPPMLVLDSRLLRRHACKPKQWFRLWPRVLCSSISSLGTSIYGMSGGRFQLVSDRPCLCWETYTIGMASGTLESSANLYDFGK